MKLPSYDLSPWPEREKAIRIPIRVGNNGEIEYFYGGALPVMKEGTIGDLVVPAWSISEEKEALRLQQEHIVQLLRSGSVVMLVVDHRRTPDELRKHLKEGIQRGSRNSMGVEVILRQELMLRLRGTKPASLKDVTCCVPSLEEEAKSLNHAYRLVSEKFEPQRRSHSANVFKVGYYVDPKDRWISLDSLRNAAEASVEMLFSRIGAKIVESLPKEMGSALRKCWGGFLNSQETLREDLARWRSKLGEAHEDACPAQIQEIYDLMEAMLKSISGTTPQDHIRVMQACVTYLLRGSGGELNINPSVRLTDDLLVVRAIAEVFEQREVPVDCTSPSRVPIPETEAHRNR